MLHLILMLNAMKILMKKTPNLNLIIVSEYQNTKKKLLKIYTQNWSEEVFIISKIKNSFNSCINKKRHYIKMSQYFPEPCRSFGGNINVKVDLSNYATKADLKNLTHADTLSFALKPSLASLKTEFDKLDIDKLAPVLVDLRKLSDVVKNEVVKKLCMIN